MPQHVKFESCSETVGNALGPDVMKSVKPLIPDILQSVPVLLYQGKQHARTLATYSKRLLFQTQAQTDHPGQLCIQPNAHVYACSCHISVLPPAALQWAATDIKLDVFMSECRADGCSRWGSQQ